MPGWEQGQAPDAEALYGTVDDMPAGMETTHRIQHINEDDVDIETPKGCWYRFTHGIRGLWATRMTEDTKADRELYVRTTLRELVIYIVFLVILSVLTFGMTSTSMYYYTKVMSELFLDAQFPDTRNNFRGMTHPLDFWRFVETPLVDGLYWENWYNNDNVSEYGYIYYENKILGVPRIRQLKVRNDSCTVHEDFANEIPYCYDVYSKGNEDHDNFGPMLGVEKPAYSDVNMRNESAWVYYTEEEMDGSTHWGLLATYTGGGFVQDLGATRQEAVDVFNTLKSNLWIDRGTRAVFFDFTVYNANINLFCVVKLIVEFPATGGAVPSWSFRTVKLIRYVTVLDYFVLACEFIFILFILYYTVEEAIEISIHKCPYFKSIWNLMDVVVLIMAYLCIVFNVYRTVTVESLLNQVLHDNDGAEYLNFDFFGYWQTMFNNLNGVMVFFAWVKTFKYISFNKTMTQLSSTLSRCGKDIGGFLMMFGIIFFAFAQLGYLIFGTQVRDFSTFTHAIFTQLRIVLGDFDFHQLEQANRVLGPLFFIAYVFFVFFVLLNMFLAIINDTYSEVKAELAQQKNEFELTDYFKRGYKRMVSKLTMKRERIIDIQKALEAADMDGDKILNFDEWKTELKARGYADQEIEQVFAKYDADGDRMLDEKEQERMMSDLENKKKDGTTATLVGADSDDDDKLDEGLPGVTLEEFDVLAKRVDRMEHSIGSIVSKIDAVLVKLEAMEKAKSKHKDKLGELVQEINSDPATTEQQKRQKMEQLVQEELQKIEGDSGLGSTGSSGRASRASRPQSSNK